MNRRDAFKLGMVRYRTGFPCRRGHKDERFVSTGICVVCNRENAARSRNVYNIFRELESKGYEKMWVRVHPEDKDKMVKFSESLIVARESVKPGMSREEFARLEAERQQRMADHARAEDDKLRAEHARRSGVVPPVDAGYEALLRYPASLKASDEMAAGFDQLFGGK